MVSSRKQMMAAYGCHHLFAIHAGYAPTGSAARTLTGVSQL